jgi:hypothetical protein
MAKALDSTQDGISEIEVARCAYEIWEREGRPEGRSTEHWLEAEASVRQRTSGATSAETKARRATSAPRSANPKREKRFEMVS